MEDGIQTLEQMSAYAQERNSKAFNQKLGRIKERISQFGTSVQQYKQFQTKEDAKAVAATWRGAKEAFEDLENVYNDLGEYAVGSALNEDTEDISTYNNIINRAKAHFLTTERVAEGEVIEDASEKYDIDILETAARISQGNTEEYFKQKKKEPTREVPIEELVEKTLD